MNTCWKCGRDLPEPQTECERENCRTEPHAPRNTELRAWAQDLTANLVSLDWDKVKTPEDMLIVIRVIFEGVKLDRRTPAAQMLLRYWKRDDTKNSGAEPTNPT